MSTFLVIVKYCLEVFFLAKDALIDESIGKLMQHSKGIGLYHLPKLLAFTIMS